MATERLKGKTLKVTGLLEELEKDAIKDKVDIVALFREFGVELKQKGKSWTGCCPWHPDKTPSLSVDREKGLYNCFGCGESGDVVTLVEKMKRLPFKDALKFLQEHVGAVQVPNTSEPRTEIRQELPATKALTHDITLSSVAEFYHKKLFENKAAIAYLEGRGFKDHTLFTRFKLGYADGSLLNVVSNGQREALRVLGILRDSGDEHLSGCITFPVLDDPSTGSGDQALSLYGRRADDTEPKHLYLSGQHKGVWNRKASKVYDEILLTESIIDGLSLIALGIENAQACYGTNGFTAEHLQVLKDDRVKTVVIAFDADEAGRKAAGRLQERFTGEGFTVKTVEPPQGKDWNEFLIKGGKKEDVEAVINAAKSAEPVPTEKKAFMVVKEGGVYCFEFEDITYRLLGVKEVFVTDLKVSIRAIHGGESYPDKLDLYSARSRAAYSASLAAIFGVESKRIERDLIRMLEHLEDQRDKALSMTSSKPAEMNPEEKEAGLALLQNPKLFDTITEDMTTLGYVGEEVNKKLVYLVAVSRLLPKPLSVYIQAGSGSGKSYLFETLRKLLPADSVKALTSFSDQSLNYLSEEDFQDKVFMVGEAIHNDIVEAQVRQMQSENELSRLVTLKDPKTGELGSREIRHKVRISFMMSSTAFYLNPENASRCLVLHVDESVLQTERVLEKQRARRTFEGYAVDAHLVPAIMKKHIAAQRLLEKIPVFNPFARLVEFPKTRTVMRRAQDQFLSLMEASCLLRQKQKERVTRQDTRTGKEIEGIECDLEDYRIAYELFTQGVLAGSASDLPHGTAELYEEIRKLSAKLAKKESVKTTEATFIQQQVRDYTGLGAPFVKKHMKILLDYEYIQPASGKRHGTRWSYRLREDRPVGELDMSVIPLPEAIAEKSKI
jgi:DNA primase catalytic core